MLIEITSPRCWIAYCTALAKLLVKNITTELAMRSGRMSACGHPPRHLSPELRYLATGEDADGSSAVARSVEYPAAVRVLRIVRVSVGVHESAFKTAEYVFGFRPPGGFQVYIGSHQFGVSISSKYGKYVSPMNHPAIASAWFRRPAGRIIPRL